MTCRASLCYRVFLTLIRHLIVNLFHELKTSLDFLCAEAAPYSDQCCLYFLMLDVLHEIIRRYRNTMNVSEK